jgi:hypothetical protein
MRRRLIVGTTRLLLAIGSLPTFGEQAVRLPAQADGSAGRGWLPRIEASFRPWIAHLSGDVVARESGRPSATMGRLRFREDLGISGASLVYEGALRIHATPRDTLVADVLLGSATGMVRLANDTPFDDVTFAAATPAHTHVSLRTWGVGYRRRLWTPMLWQRPLLVDVGVGFRGLGSITKMRTALVEDSEDVFAPILPSLDLAGQLALTPRLALWAALLGGPQSLPVLTDEPARASFFAARLLGELRLTRYLAVHAGFVYVRAHLAFIGTESDGDHADNRTNLRLLGGSLGLTVRF